jgi:hypothetical protein
MIGGAVLFDIDKIFTVGGVQNYDVADEPASPRAYTIDISLPDDPIGPRVVRLPDMAWGRTTLNVVALPNGMVAVVGGQTNTRPFSDDFAVLSVEMYDPAAQSWFEFSQPLTTARNYHSAALLMKDGRILAGGGGLCSTGCDIHTTWVRDNKCHFESQRAARPASSYLRHCLSAMIRRCTSEPLQRGHRDPAVPAGVQRHACRPSNRRRRPLNVRARRSYGNSG